MDSGCAVAWSQADNTLVLRMGANIDRSAAERLRVDAIRAHAEAQPGACLVIDTRGKSFADLQAQRMLSSGVASRSDLPKVAHYALWVEAEHLVGAEAGDLQFERFSDPASSLAPPWVRAWHQRQREGVHLIAGSTGAGKSTYAMQLADDFGGVHFNIDEWMKELYQMDRPDEAGFDWYMPRIDRCQGRMRSLASRLNPLGVPAILDCGLSDTKQRGEFIAWAADADIKVQLHYVEVPTDRRWQRVQTRNQQRGDTFHLQVSRAMFDFVEARFQPPADSEGADLVRVWS